MEKSSKRKAFGLALFLIAAIVCLVFSFFTYKEYKQEIAVIEQTTPITDYQVIDTEEVTGKKTRSYYATVLYHGREYNSVRITPYMYRSHDFSKLCVYYDKENDDIFSEQEATMIHSILILCLSLIFFFTAYKVWSEQTK